MAAVWGFTKPILIGAVSGSALSSLTYTANYLATAPHINFFKGLGGAALSGAVTGAIGGVSGHISNSISGNTGWFGASVGGSVGNMAIAASNGTKYEDLWKYGLSGFTTSTFGTTGGYGIAYKGMLGKLGYQLASTATLSISNNIASGAHKPFTDFMVGVGPINIRLGKINKSIVKLEDNLDNIIPNSIGAVNFLVGQFMDSTKSSVGFDVNSLSFNWKGGPVG